MPLVANPRRAIGKAGEESEHEHIDSSISYIFYVSLSKFPRKSYKIFLKVFFCYLE